MKAPNDEYFWEVSRLLPFQWLSSIGLALQFNMAQFMSVLEAGVGLRIPALSLAIINISGILALDLCANHSYLWLSQRRG